jgi:hypothetical protein
MLLEAGRADMLAGAELVLAVAGNASLVKTLLLEQGRFLCFWKQRRFRVLQLLEARFYVEY